MQPLYPYLPDADNFTAFGLRDQDRHLIGFRNVPEPIAHGWNAVSIEVFEAELLEGDFPSLVDYCTIPVFSERAWKTLMPLIGYCCEALPIVHPSFKSYYLIHVMDILPCLDEDKSEVRRSRVDSRISRVFRYSFKRDMLERRHIFKLPVESGGDLIVSGAFRRIVEEHRLQGLVFKELRMVE